MDDCSPLYGFGRKFAARFNVRLGFHGLLPSPLVKAHRMPLDAAHSPHPAHGWKALYGLEMADRVTAQKQACDLRFDAAHLSERIVGGTKRIGPGATATDLRIDPP